MEDAPARPRLLTPGFALILLATLSYFASLGAVNPVLPRFVSVELGAGDIAVGVAVGAFTVTAIALRPVAGRLGDRRGRRLLVVGGAWIAALSHLGLIAASSLPPVIGARLLLGIGEAAFFVGAATAVTDLAPPERRGEAVSLFALVLYAGVGIGPLVGETTLDRAGFAPVWLVAAAFAAVAALLALRMPDTRPEAAGSGRLLHQAAVVPGTVLATSVFGLSAFMAFAPLYALGLGMRGIRFVLLVYAVIVLAIRSAGARIPDRFGPRPTAALALGSSVTGLLVMAAWGSPAGLFAGAAIFAVGQAMAFPALLTLAVAGVRPAERGSVVGTFASFFDLSFGVGAVSMGAVAEAIGYRGSFAVAAVVAAAGLVLLGVIGGRQRAVRFR